MKPAMKAPIVCLFALIVAGTRATSATSATSAPTDLSGIQAEMRSLHFDKAVELADQAVAAKGENAEEALFLRATALFQGKKFADAAIECHRRIADFQKSDWRHKAVFLKAQAMIEQKKFAEAAAIDQAESARILSPERKQALVGEILRFAEKLEAKADPNVPDAPKPDFAKADSLYTKALAIELPRDFRDDIVFRRARAIQQSGNANQAIQDFQAYLTEYDPAWTGPAGSGFERLAMVNPPPAGGRCRNGDGRGTPRPTSHSSRQLENAGLVPHRANSGEPEKTGGGDRHLAGRREGLPERAAVVAEPERDHQRRVPDGPRCPHRQKRGARHATFQHVSTRPSA
jgi:tetratricopeptide (TPR) repeat protein